MLCNFLHKRLCTRYTKDDDCARYYKLAQQNR